MRSNSRLSHLLTVVSLACAGCSSLGGSPGSNQTADGGASGGGDGHNGSHLASGVIAPIGGDAPKIAVMTLFADGTVTDDDMRLDTGPSPRRAAISPDGREAAVIWSGAGPGNPKGVTFINLGTDPASQAAVSTSLDLKLAQGGQPADYDQSPTAITYVSQDEVLIAVRGPDTDGIIAATRTGASWTLGDTLEITDGPHEIHPVPGTQDALVLTFPLFSSQSEVITIRRTSPGVWTKIGQPATLDTSVLQLAMHASGQYAYIASEEPVVDNPKGRVHVLTPGADGAWALTSMITLSNTGSSQISIDPKGAFAIVPTGIAGTSKYTFLTIDLSSPGAPVEVPTSTTVDGSLMNDVEIGPDGQMFVSLDLPAGGGHALFTMVQSSPGQWDTIWGPKVQTGGVDDVALATISTMVD